MNTLRNDKISAALATVRCAVAKAKTADDVVNDHAALRVLAEIEARIDETAQAIERQENEVTADNYAATWLAINSMYRTMGDLQAVAASAGTRRGGYKGAAATNAIRALSAEQRDKIKGDFERARTDGTGKEIVYRQLARRYKVSDRTIRRAVTDHR